MDDIESKSVTRRGVPNPKRVAHAGSGHHCPQEVKDAVLARIADGMPIHQSMALSGYHKAELYDWVREDPEYGERFKRARESLAHTYAEESVTLPDTASADDVADAKRASAHVNLVGLRSRSRQWLASRMLPDVYGEKIEHRGTITQAVVLLPPLDPLPAHATARIATGPATVAGPVTDADVVQD